MHATPPGVLILGIGNLLWADEGFGVRAVEYLHRHWSFGDHVRLADGGTQGIYLVQDIRDAQMLVVFDAVDYGLPPRSSWSRGMTFPAFWARKRSRCTRPAFRKCWPWPR
jgi:hydrogenase maturation protease